MWLSPRRRAGLVGMHPELTFLVADGGAVSRRSHPHLRHAMDAALRRRELARVLPGVYALPRFASELRTRARAVHLLDPDAVIIGEAAARLVGWDVALPAVMTVATTRQHAPAAGITWLRQRALGPSRVFDGYRVASKALIAVDLSATMEDAFELAALNGVPRAKVEKVMARTGNRPGNRTRRRRLKQTRDNPWSILERKAHAHLRRAGVKGWEANRAIVDRWGERLGVGDLVWVDLGLVIELDGKTHRPAADAVRDLAMQRAGWEVIRFKSAVVLKSPRVFAAAVRDIVDSRSYRRLR